MDAYYIHIHKTQENREKKSEDAKTPATKKKKETKKVEKKPSAKEPELPELPEEPVIDWPKVLNKKTLDPWEKNLNKQRKNPTKAEFENYTPQQVSEWVSLLPFYGFHDYYKQWAINFKITGKILLNMKRNEMEKDEISLFNALHQFRIWNELEKIRRRV